MHYLLHHSKILFLIYFVLLIASGARGSLVFSLLIILIHKFLEWNKYFRRKYSLKLIKKILLILGVFIFSAPFYLNKILESNFFKLGLNRITSLLNFNNDDSSLGRINRFGFTLESVFDSPLSVLFGHGYGSFGILYTGIDGREYPHNIYLESLFELGLIGLLIVICFTLAPFFLKRDFILKVLTFYLFLGAQKTGSLSDHWVLFAFYGILIFNPAPYIINKAKNLSH